MDPFDLGPQSLIGLASGRRQSVRHGWYALGETSSGRHIIETERRSFPGVSTLGSAPAERVQRQSRVGSPSRLPRCRHVSSSPGGEVASSYACANGLRAGTQTPLGPQTRDWPHPAHDLLHLLEDLDRSAYT